MTHVVVSVDDLVHLDTRTGGPVVASLLDGDVVVALAARDPLLGPIGPWLAVGEDYPASMAARDVASLSWFVDFDDAVIAGDRASEHATLVRAMLTDDEVTLETDVASVHGAYNRPAPPRPIRIWYTVDGAIVHDSTVLRGIPVESATTTQHYHD